MLKHYSREAALYAQKRMGEITRDMPVKSGRSASRVGITPAGTIPKMERLSNEGINRKKYSEAEQLAKNPEILDRVIK